MGLFSPSPFFFFVIPGHNYVKNIGDVEDWSDTFETED